ncbi:MAG: type III-A CRISPR-associated protein Cas10/Csm1 [Thermoanaerobacteraceae bacterium]|nr:type III-A CRISPR-associated protein Cas10/Csm1 [Thermoanaerobacteraceae bacterium]
MEEIDSPFYGEEFETVVYGALFHDIGKFYQRTRNTRDKAEVEKSYEWYLSQLGKHYITHQEWSAHFLRTVLKDERTEIIALKHHAPEKKLELMVAIADKLSAAERDEEGPSFEGKVDVSSVPLYSVLSTVKHIRQGVQDGTVGYKKLRFDVISDSYPVSRDSEAILEGDYQQWWNEFKQKITATLARKDSGLKKFYQLYHLLQRYTQTIPSAAYYSSPTISLFDHSKATAAIASAFYRQGLDKETLESMHRALLPGGKKKDKNEPMLLLVSGDISGIQDFVFDITSKGAAKGLRGRSFYLSVLCDAIANYILYQERLFPCNILYSGGGHFYLLLPVSARSRLADYKKHVDEILYRAHRGKLAVILSSVSLTLSDFDRRTFGSKWKEVGALSQKEKNRKFLELIKQAPERVLGPVYEGQEVCVLCGSTVKTTQDKCSFCESFEELGDKIARQHPYVLEYFFSPRETSTMNNVSDVLTALGYRLEFAEKPDNRAIVSVINSTSVEKYQADKTYWLANVAPLKSEGRIATFEEIAQSSTGDNMWGVLRGDVDNLGRVFSEGLGEDRSISKIAALSREISFFFSAIFNQICLRHRDSVYVIYAGGDDFFLVGSWSVLPAVAAEINQEFRRYCSNNPHLTLSCAISIAPGITYPLFKVAHTAGEELDRKAKSIREVGDSSHEKDSICFLGHAFSWDELGELKEVKDLIVKAIGTEGVSKALITYINSAYIDQCFYCEGKYPLNRVWRLVYALSRLAARHKQARATLKELEKRIITSRTLIYKNSVYAARWAEKELRTRRD